MAVSLKGNLGDWQLVRMPLLDKNGDEVWLQHPEGQDLDVAVCRVNEIPPSVMAYSLPRPDETTDMATLIAMDVFIVGFPHAMSHQDVLVAGKTVNCDDRGQDDFGRTIAVCTAGSLELIDTMVRRGLAWAFRSYSTDYVSARDIPGTPLEGR